MKRKFLALGVILVCVLCMGALTTRTSSYATLDTIANINTPDTDLAAATGFFVGVPSGSIDMLKDAGAGYETYANRVSLILHVATGANGDTVTQVLYGVVDQGPPQRIASIVWKIGLAQVDATATNLWAETATVTSLHPSTITAVGDDGDDMVGAVVFDLAGFRYVKSYFTADTGNPTTVTCLYRYF